MNLLKNYYWKESKAILGKHLINKSPSIIRKVKWQFGNTVKNGGWHFSYLMNKEQIAEKIQSFSHTEYNKNKFTDLKNIENAIKNKKDLFGRSSEDLNLSKKSLIFT